MKLLCTICARGGSKGVERKNLQPLAGKPLIAHTLEQAVLSGLFDAIAVSSDSEEILDVGHRYGATHAVRRPDKFATDEAGKVPAIRHCAETVEQLNGTEFDAVIDLAVTSPFRNLMDIRNVIDMITAEGATTVLSGCVAASSPYFSIVERNDAGHWVLCKSIANRPLRRQDAPPVYDLNGAVYAWRRGVLGATNEVFNPDAQLYVMPPERGLDIDSHFDFVIAEALIARENG